MWKDEIFGSNLEKQKMLVNIILDKSGSMYSATNDTIGGFNQYINKLKEDKDVEYTTSLTMFDTVFDIRYVNKPVNDVPLLDTKTYVASGNTALLDAVGKTIQEISDNDPKQKILVVIMTDGEENSSREFKWEDIQKLIKEKDGKENWTFIYLGAMADAWDKGNRFGFSASNVARYSHGATMDVLGTVLASGTACLSKSIQMKADTFYQSAGYATTDFSNGDWDKK